MHAVPRRTPFRRILVGIDGASAGVDALALGLWLAARSGARLSAVAVVAEDAMPPAGIPVSWQVAGKISSDEAPVSGRLIRGTSPVRSLRDEMLRTKADLLVLGASPGARPDQAILGTTSQRLLAGARFSIAIAPEGFRDQCPDPDDPISITCALSGTPECYRALEYADALTRDHDQLEIVAANSMAELETGEAETLEKALAFGVAASGVSSVMTRLRNGAPAEVLTEIEADLLVMGSRGHGRLVSALAGGVSRKVIGSSRSPLLVVPSGAPPRPRRGEGRS